MARLRYKKLPNTRDLGGMRTEDGRTIRPHKLIRSGKLTKLPQRTLHALGELGITTVVDLRIESERRADPDCELKGCNYVHLPVLCFPALGISSDFSIFDTVEKERVRVQKEGERIKQFGGIDRYMIETYRSILFSETSKQELARFLKLVRDEEGCILWHCASGKDRAGICSMLVEALLGVGEAAILEDYMRSGRYLWWKYAANRLGIVTVPFSLDLKRILLALMRTKRTYLARVIDDMKQNYGGIVGYCKEELGVTEEDITLFRTKYLL